MHRRLLPLDRLGRARTSPASWWSPSGSRASEEAARLFAEDHYQQYLFLHGLSVEMAEATGRVLAPPHPRGARLRRRGRARPSPACSASSTGAAATRGATRPARTSTDNAKVVELLGGERIGVTVSEGFQLHPEQTTDAIICHHPEAKYFVA